MNKGARPLSEEEVKAIIRTWEDSQFYWRNKSLVLLGICTGFRISELLSLSIDSVTNEGRIADQVYVPARNMKEKRGRKKRIYPEAKDALYEWIKIMAERYNATYDSPVFYSSQTGRSLTSRGVYNMLRRAIRKTGFSEERVGTHSLRKTFASHMYEHMKEKYKDSPGVELMHRMKNELGHEDLESTYSYLQFKFDEEKPSNLFKDFVDAD